VRQNQNPKSRWTNGIWITRVATVVGVVAVGVGLANPRLFQINVFGFLALAAVALSAAGIVASFWRIGPRSRRWRDLRFWASLVINLLVIAAVSFLYHRGQNLPAYDMQQNLLGGPDGSQ
jgi:hypothetical protein